MNEPVLILSGTVVTIAVYVLGLRLYRRSGYNSLLHPNTFSMGILILLLLASGYSYEEVYQPAADFISWFLKPAVVVLALPLHRSLGHLLKSRVAILSGVVAGMLVSALGVLILALAAGLTPVLALSLLPRSITTPMAIETSRTLEALVPVTVFSVIITGVSGAVAARKLLKLAGVTHPVAMGVAIGTSSHALGTSRALEIGPDTGAMSGLALALCGLMSVFFLPLFARFLLYCYAVLPV